MWDFPGPGLEPVSPALAGGLLTTAPPGEPKNLILINKISNAEKIRTASKKGVNSE